MIRSFKITLPFILACAALAPTAHADSVNGGKGAAEQCVKYQHAAGKGICHGLHKCFDLLCQKVVEHAGGKERRAV